MRLLLVPALMLPLALAACDDGSERITELEGTLESERARVVELETRVGELDTLRTERDNLIQERDALIVERDTAVGERDTFTPQIETLTTERDALTAERDTLVAERDALVTERDTIVGERDALVAERDTLVTERDTLTAERDRLTRDLEMANARVAQLERVAAEAGDGFDTAVLKEPMQAILVKLRETQAGLERLESEYGDQDGLRESVATLRSGIGETGESIRLIVEEAQIELE